MNQDENAALSYNPGEHRQAGSDGIQNAFVEAERQLMHRDGVKGVGMMKTADGKDGIVVYVVDQRVLSQLPATVGGFPVVGEITGEIRAL